MLGMNKLPIAKRVQIFTMPVEGFSLRSISRIFGRASAPIAPQAAHTMRGASAGPGMSSGQWLTSAYLAAFRLFRHGRKPGIGMLSIPALRQRAARG